MFPSIHDKKNSVHNFYTITIMGIPHFLTTNCKDCNYLHLFTMAKGNGIIDSGIQLLYKIHHIYLGYINTTLIPQTENKYSIQIRLKRLRCEEFKWCRVKGRVAQHSIWTHITLIVGIEQTRTKRNILY